MRGVHHAPTSSLDQVQAGRCAQAAALHSLFLSEGKGTAASNPPAGIHPAAMSPPENPSNGGPSTAAPSEPAPPANPAAKGKKKDEKKDDDLSVPVAQGAARALRRAGAGRGSRRAEACPREHEKYMADILSVLPLTMSAEVERESLRYRLLGSEGDIGSWGHEYVSLRARWRGFTIEPLVVELEVACDFMAAGHTSPRAAGQAGVRLPLFCQVHDPITCHRKIMSGPPYSVKPEVPPEV